MSGILYITLIFCAVMMEFTGSICCNIVFRQFEKEMINSEYLAKFLPRNQL